MTKDELLRQISELKSALLPFAREAGTFVDTVPDSYNPIFGGEYTVGDLRKAAKLVDINDGPDSYDGCDHEGFNGGCERLGHTVETCPYKGT